MEKVSRTPQGVSHVALIRAVVFAVRPFLPVFFPFQVVLSEVLDFSTSFSKRFIVKAGLCLKSPGPGCSKAG